MAPWWSETSIRIAPSNTMTLCTATVGRLTYLMRVVLLQPAPETDAGYRSDRRPFEHMDGSEEKERGRTIPLASFLGVLGRESTSCFTLIGDAQEGRAARIRSHNSLYRLPLVLEGLFDVSEVAGL